MRSLRNWRWKFRTDNTLILLFDAICVMREGGKGAVETYKAMVGYMGIEDCGVCALSGEENKNEGKMAEIKAWAKGL